MTDDKWPTTNSQLPIAKCQKPKANVRQKYDNSVTAGFPLFGIMCQDRKPVARDS